MSEPTATPAESTDPAPALDPDTFDLDSWLDGVQMMKAVVPMYARRDLMPQINDLVAELEALDDASLEERDANERAGETLATAGSTAGSERGRRNVLREQLRDLWTTYEASAIDFELTQMSSFAWDEMQRDLQKVHPDVPFDAPEAERERVENAQQEWLHLQIVARSVTGVGPHGQPRTPVDGGLSDQRLAKIEQKFGVDQLRDLIAQARALNLDSRVAAPFSRRVLAALDTTTSG